MLHKGRIFRYRIITNFHCNQNCSFCFQPEKRKKILDINKMEETMKKVGKLERCTIMGGESLLLDNITDCFRVANNYANTLCLVTNGTLLTESLIIDLVKTGLKEMAISISSMSQYIDRRKQILLAKKYVPNLRINIPKCEESVGPKLYKLIDTALSDNVGVVVCEDLMGRYNTDYKDSYEDLLYGMKAKLIKSDGHNFFTFEYKGKEFGLFGYHGDKTADANTEEAGYEKTDIIITPDCHSNDLYSHRVYSIWEDYCNDIGNYSLS